MKRQQKELKDIEGDREKMIRYWFSKQIEFEKESLFGSYPFKTCWVLIYEEIQLAFVFIEYLFLAN